MGFLPVSKKEGKGKGKNGIGPRMKNGRANPICAKLRKAMLLLLR